MVLYAGGNFSWMQMIFLLQLAQKASDLTSDLYLKEAELQYCHSQ